MSLPLESTLEALLFLSPEPVPAESLAESCGVELHEAVYKITPARKTPTSGSSDETSEVLKGILPQSPLTKPQILHVLVQIGIIGEQSS